MYERLIFNICDQYTFDSQLIIHTVHLGSLEFLINFRFPLEGIKLSLGSVCNFSSTFPSRKKKVKWTDAGDSSAG